LVTDEKPKISILINAYACNPKWGSEPGMGWNWIIHIASYCKVYVITEGEWKDEIEHELASLPQKNNIVFFYLPLSDKIRKMCWNQGDWRFYYYYKQWQKRAYNLSKIILEKYPIDIVHQLNMIGFREPGYLWKINNIPYIWGPIGGMNVFPTAYLKGASLKYYFFVYLKNAINYFQIRYSYRVNKAIKRADALISAVPASHANIKNIHKKDSVLINETGAHPDIATAITNKADDTFHILWVGHFYFRKQLSLALHTIASLKNKSNVRFHIAGNGRDEFYKQLAVKLGVDGICVWHGKIKNDEVHQLMRESHLFLFTSVYDETSTVVLESIENYLPVVCFNTSGFGAIVDESIGYKIELSNPEQSAIQFAEIIDNLNEDREKLSLLSKNCHKKIIELSWDEKMKKVMNIYQDVLDNYGKDSSYR